MVIHMIKLKKRTNKKPNFKRQEWFRYKKLGESYRKPKGKISKKKVSEKKTCNAVHRLPYPKDFKGNSPFRI